MESSLEHFFSVLTKKYPNNKVLFDFGYKISCKGLLVVDSAYPVLESVYLRLCQPRYGQQKHQLELLAPLLAGLVICFMGGSFTMLIAVVEVLRLTSWKRIKESLHLLHENYLIAYEANKKDNLVDEDGNGIPDVYEISTKELFSRKLKIFFASVNPVDVSVALNALFVAFLSVLAALRDKFANAVTFGCALADSLKYLFPLEDVLEEALPLEQKKYASTVSDMMFNSVGAAVSIIGRSYIMTLHCAFRGATLIAKSLIRIGKDRDFFEKDMDEKSSRATIFVLVTAALGFFWQASNSFSLVFPFNVMLLPFTILNWLLDLIFRSSSALA